MDILEKLVQFVETASPVIWDAAMRQVYVNAVSYLAWAVVFLALTVVAVYVVRRIYRTRYEIQAEKQAVREASKYYYGRDEDENEITLILASIGAVASGLLTLMLVHAGIGRFVNPVYWAINMLLDGFPH